MTTAAGRFAAFAALHRAGRPVVLFNAWDAGSAKAIADAGAPAIATGSCSVAAAQGFADGEALPLGDVLATACRIVAAVNLPVSIDVEGGYAVAPDAVAANVAALAETGAIGCNFEDQVVGTAGLHPVSLQAARIAAIRARVGTPFFINARTDLFLQAPAARPDGAMIEEAIARGRAYADAGADGFFVPGLCDLDRIARIAAAVALPVNVLSSPGAPSTRDFASAGVARISHGPNPYRAAMAQLGAAARAIYRG